MTAAAIALLTLSAVIHAGWNLVSKQAHPTAGFFLSANLVGAAFTMPWVLALGGSIFLLPAYIWSLVAITGLFQSVYFLSLAAAYRHGDLSLAYPVARSLPVILVPIAALLLGRGERLSLLFLAGAVLVLAGGLLAPLEDLAFPRFRKGLDPSLIMAACAAAGTTGYSLVDDLAVRTIRAAVADGSLFPWTMAYLCLEALSCAAWLGLFRLAGRRQRISGFAFGQAATAGLGIYTAYALVLLAMAHAREVSYVVAFRQVGILIGAGMGVIILKERVTLPKLAGIGLLTAGLGLVSMG